jgi:Zn ribbon nucleic-acid-binding protein
MEYWGNEDLLKEHKTAFLCSRKLPASAIINSYDWAKEQREAGTCVVCGYHSQVEKDVFDILLKGQQPLILVLARGMKSRWRAAEHYAVAVKRLLVISPFEKR